MIDMEFSEIMIRAKRTEYVEKTPMVCKFPKCKMPPTHYLNIEVASHQDITYNLWMCEDHADSVLRDFKRKRWERHNAN